MKLYFFPVAPNPTRVRLYIAEKRAAGGKLDVEEVLVSIPDGEQNAPEHLARNPLGRLPVLELDDGSYLTESLTIVEYLEELCPEPPMIGRDPLGRARVREIERIIDLGVLYPIARIVHSTDSPLGLPPNPEMARHFSEQLPRGLQLLEDRLADGRPFIAGEHPTIADCTLAAGLQFGRFGRVDFDPSFAQLWQWDARYRERDTAKSILLM